MNYLVDTHTLIWIAEDSPQLSKRVKKLFTDSDHQFFLSAASVWEIAIKYSLQKIVLPVSPQDFIETMLEGAGTKICPIRNSHLYTVATLPFHHRDPFDRLIVAQAMCEKLTVLTKDKSFEKYDINVTW